MDTEELTAALPSTRLALLAEEGWLARWLELFNPASRRIWAGLAIVVAMLLTLSAAASTEGRFGLGSVLGPSSDNPDLRLKGMSFLGDTMVWPFLFLVPAAAMLVNVALRKIDKLVANIAALLDPSWIASHKEEYAGVLTRLAGPASTSVHWRWVRRMAWVLGITFFAWNTLTCAFPEMFRPYVSHQATVFEQGGFTVREFPDGIAVPKWDTDPSGAPITWLLARLWVLTLGYVWIPPLIYMMARSVRVLYVLASGFSKHRGAFRVQPLAADKAGGLSSLSDATLAAVYPMSVVGIMMVMPFMKENTQASIHNWILFLPFVPVFAAVFFLPLMGVHEAMQDAKLEMLERYGELYTRLSNRFLAEVELERSDSATVATLHAAMEGIRLNHDQVSQMPVWPFHTSAIVRLSTVVALPLVIALGNALLGALVGAWLTDFSR